MNVDINVALTRLFDKIDDLQAQIRHLCNKQSETDRKIVEHLKVEEALDEYRKEIKDNSEKKFYIIIALMGIGFTAFEILSIFHLGG